MIPDAPQDWAQLHWHRAPGPARYRSRETAQRACNWLNNNDGDHAVWFFRVGPCAVPCALDHRWYLERRWIGQVLGLIDLEAGMSNPPDGDPPTVEGL